MALPVKSGNAQPTRSGLKKGSLIVGTGNEDYGTTSTTSYWNNINIPTDGYIVTTLGLNNSPISFAAANTNELINIANYLGGTATTLDEAKVYLCTRASTWLLNNTPNNIVTEGLIMRYDIKNLSSYPGSGVGVLDLSGADEGGTLINGVAFNANGYLEFDGVDDYIQTTTTYSLPSTATNFTMGGWLKMPTNTLTSGLTFISNYNSENDATTLGPFNSTVRGGSAASNAGKFQASTKDTSGSWVSLYSLSRVDDGNWYYCVYSKDGTTYKLYVNGVNETTTISTNVGVTTITNDITIGVLNYYLDRSWFPGSIADVGIYDRALSQAEILQNYYQAPIITDGLVFAIDAGNLGSYENGDTTIHSLVDSINGTLTNGVGFDSNNNGSLDFDGVDDYIALTSTITNSIYTLNFWYKMGVNDGSYGYFTGVTGGKGLAISEGGTAVGLSYGNFYYFNGGAVKMTQSTLLTTGVWNNISAVIDTSAGNIKIYLNGSIITNQSVSSMSTSVSEIGRYVPTNSNFLNGNMASFKIYNKELSAAEVLQNYNATRARYS